jgi:TolB protein
MRVRHVAAGLLLFACALARGADIEIVKQGSIKTSIDLTQLKVAPEFAQVLRNDLVRSGWFEVVPEGRAGVVVSGTGQLSGTEFSVECRAESAATGRRYLGRTFVGRADQLRRLAHAVADAIVESVTGQKGIASTRIVMIGVRGAQRDLYMCDADGLGFVQVTRDGAVCISPRWSSDADALVYTSFVSGYPDIYEIDLQSYRRRRIVNFPGLNSGAAMSPDGREMALTLSKDGNPDLYVMDMRSRAIRRLTRTQHAAEASPTWSPDGRQIAFVSDRSGSPHVYVVPSRGGREQRITFQGRENVTPDWGPDGRIVCSSRRSGRYQICVVDAERASEEQITSDYVDHESPAWAPDGRHIVCSRTERYASDVYILDTLGDPPIRLTTLQGDWHSPDWSPR